MPCQKPLNKCLMRTGLARKKSAFGEESRSSVRGRYEVHLFSVAVLALLIPLTLLAADPTPEPTPTPTLVPTPTPASTPENNDTGEAALPGNMPDAATPPASDATESTPTPPDNEPTILIPKALPAVVPDASPTPASAKKPPAVLYTPATPATQIVTSLTQQGSTNGESLFTGLGGVPNPLSARYLSPAFDRRLGFVLDGARIYPTVQIGTVYRFQRGDSVVGGDYNDVYATISPAVTILLGTEEAGRILTLQYQGVLSLGQTEGMGNYDQSLQVNGNYTFTKLTLGVSLQAMELSGADQDFSGDNASRLLLSLSGHVVYQYSEVTNVDSTLSTPIRLYQQGDSSEGLTSQTFLNYIYSPLTTAGVGLGLGTLVVEGRTQVFEQALLRLNYAYSVSLALNATFGYEFRQTGDKEENTPIYVLGVTWQPRDGTSLALSGQREIYNSAALSDTNYATTSISLTATQNIGRYLQASLSLGFNDNSYEQVGAAKTYGREEQYYLVQGGLNARLNAQWNLLLNASFGYLNSSGGQPSLVTQAAQNGSVYGTANGNLRVFQTSLQLGYAF